MFQTGCVKTTVGKQMCGSVCWGERSLHLYNSYLQEFFNFGHESRAKYILPTHRLVWIFWRYCQYSLPPLLITNHGLSIPKNGVRKSNAKTYCENYCENERQIYVSRGWAFSRVETLALRGKHEKMLLFVFVLFCFLFFSRIMTKKKAKHSLWRYWETTRQRIS